MMKRSRRGDLLVELAQSPPNSRPGSLKRRKTDELPLRATEEAKNAGDSEGSDGDALMRARKSPEQLFRLSENEDGDKNGEQETKKSVGSRSLSNPPSAAKPSVVSSRGMRMVALAKVKDDDVDKPSSIAQTMTDKMKAQDVRKWIQEGCSSEDKLNLLKDLLEDKQLASSALPLVLTHHKNSVDTKTLLTIAKDKVDVFHHLAKDSEVVKHQKALSSIFHHVEGSELPTKVVDQVLDQINLGELGVKFNLALSKGTAHEVSFSDCVSICEALLKARPGIQKQLLSSVPSSTLVDVLKLENLPDFTEKLKKKLGVESWADLREKLGGGVATSAVQAEGKPLPGKEEFVKVLQGMVYRPNVELKALAEEIASAITSDRTQCAKFLNAIEHYLLFSV